MPCPFGNFDEPFAANQPLAIRVREPAVDNRTESGALLGLSDHETELRRRGTRPSGEEHQDEERDAVSAKHVGS